MKTEDRPHTGFDAMHRTPLNEVRVAGPLHDDARPMRSAGRLTVFVRIRTPGQGEPHGMVHPIRFENHLAEKAAKLTKGQWATVTGKLVWRNGAARILGTALHVEANAG